MIASIAQKRLREVLMIDSINTSQPDFLATHVPFRTIKVIRGLKNETGAETISEDSIYSRYFDAIEMRDKHQFIVVEGSSGSGKSHFIRWIHAKLSSSENNTDVVMLIRRSDNTLKGTIKQLLEIPEIQNIKNRDAHERLVKANQAISEQKFKDSIYQSFLVEIKNDEKESDLTNVQKKNLIALLSNSLFEERMMKAGGPIDRIFRKVASTSGIATQDALFFENDFILNTDFGEELNYNGADRKAIKMANSLIPDESGDSMAAIVCSYLNSLVENVIQSCAGIEPGDFQQIFKEIRQELYRQGKRLTLLIEDITSFTGINQALLNALITEHTGLNEADHLCRLLSVIGTTTQYYEEFRSNYKDRITMQITIEDGTIGNNDDDLYQFVAKYLNAMSLEYADVKTWYESGALDTEYPVHEFGYAWSDFYEYQGKRIDLYPFTKQAIKNLYMSMGDHKTPRYIIRDIIEPAVNEIIYDKKQFLLFLRDKKYRLNGSDESQVMSIIGNMSFENDTQKIEYRARVLSLLNFWGNGTFSSNEKEISGISRKFFDEFGLTEFSNCVGANRQGPTIVEPPLTPTDPSVTKTLPQKYLDFEKAINEWHFDGKIFPSARGELRDAICSFVFSSVNWQQEGIPLDLKRMVETSTYTLVAIERQERAIEKGLVILKDNDETYSLLKCFNRWLYLGKKSWNYASYSNGADISAASDLYFVTLWLERNKEHFVQVIKGYKNDSSVPEYVKCAMVLDIYSKIFNEDICVKKYSDVSIDSLIVPVKTKKLLNGHTQAWLSVRDLLLDNKKAEEIHQVVLNYFNLIQGVSIASKYILQMSSLDEAFRSVRKDHGSIQIQEKSKFPKMSEIERHYENITSKLSQVMVDELTEAKKKAEKVLAFWEYDFDVDLDATDIRDLMNDIKNFYTEAELYGIAIEYRYETAEKYKENASEIVSALRILTTDFSSEAILDVICAFSSNPLKTIDSFIAYLNQVETDVSTVY